MYGIDRHCGINLAHYSDPAVGIEPITQDDIRDGPTVLLAKYGTTRSAVPVATVVAIFKSRVKQCLLQVNSQGLLSGVAADSINSEWDDLLR